MKIIAKIGLLSIGLVMIVHSFGFCATKIIKAEPESNIITQRIDYLEKKVNDNQKSYSNMLTALNIYIAIFLGIVALGAGLTWWNNNVQSKKQVEKQLDESKVQLSEFVIEELANREQQYNIRFSVLQGQTHEAFARNYQEIKKYDIAYIWYARAFKEYYDKSSLYVEDEHKERILSWILRCLNEMKELEDTEANELIKICNLINENIFGIQKKKIIARIDELSKPKKDSGK